MTTELRFVFDTNTVVSALLLKNSVSRKAFDTAREQGILLISKETMTELNEVLRREKFDKYLTEQERLHFLAKLVREAHLIEVINEIQECRDPDDDKFLELAVSGRADFLVSGDKDLLTMNPFRQIPIVTPRELMLEMSTD
jgi:uncharacterized protein